MDARRSRQPLWRLKSLAAGVDKMSFPATLWTVTKDEWVTVTRANGCFGYQDQLVLCATVSCLQRLSLAVVLSALRDEDILVGGDVADQLLPLASLGGSCSVEINTSYSSLEREVCGGPSARRAERNAAHGWLLGLLVRTVGRRQITAVIRAR